MADKEGRRKRALRRQIAANSRVGAGMAALWECVSPLNEERMKNLAGTESG